jgi:hypothetical protein
VKDAEGHLGQAVRVNVTPGAYYDRPLVEAVNGEGRTVRRGGGRWRLVGVALDERHCRELCVLERQDRPARMLAVSLAQLAGEFVPAAVGEGGRPHDRG